MGIEAIATLDLARGLRHQVGTPPLVIVPFLMGDTVACLLVGARNPYVGRDVGIPRSSSSLASSSRPRRAATFLQQCSTVQLYSVLDLVQLYYSCTVVQL